MATRMMFLCPHCKGKTKTRTSRGLSPTLRELVYQCEDPECSYSFVVQAEAVRTLSPSGKPNPAINLPNSLRIAAQLTDQPAEAEPSSATV